MAYKKFTRERILNEALTVSDAEATLIRAELFERGFRLIDDTDD